MLTFIEAELSEVEYCEDHMTDIIDNSLHEVLIFLRQIKREMKSSKNVKSIQKLSRVADK